MHNLNTHAQIGSGQTDMAQKPWHLWSSLAITDRSANISADTHTHTYVKLTLEGWPSKPSCQMYLLEENIEGSDLSRERGTTEPSV